MIYMKASFRDKENCNKWSNKKEETGPAEGKYKEQPLGNNWIFPQNKSLTLVK